MKTTLVDEFHLEENAALIHARLLKRKKLESETSRQYVYEMLDIGSQGGIDEKALIQYVAGGMPGEDFEKITLYEATTVKELKKRLDVFDMLREKQTNSESSTKMKFESNQKPEASENQRFLKNLVRKTNVSSAEMRLTMPNLALT